MQLTVCAPHELRLLRVHLPTVDVKREAILLVVRDVMSRGVETFTLRPEVSEQTAMCTLSERALKAI